MKKLIFFIIYFNFIICNILAQEVQQDNSLVITSSNDDDKNEDDFLYEQIRFTESGLKCFFKHKFNNPKYTSDILPYNLTDLLNFLEYCKSTNQNKKFIKSILKMFHQRLKFTDFVIAKEFNRFTDKLPDLVDYSFMIGMQTDTHLKIKNILYSEFLNKFQFFQEDPYKFINNTSDQICNSIAKDSISIDDITSDELRAVILRVLENICSKLVWFIEDDANIWGQLKKTCELIYSLKEKNLIYDLDDINDLLLSAISRFTIILELRGSDLQFSFYETMLNDIVNNPPVWLNIREQDDMMTTKKETLLIAAKSAHAKAIAKQKFGIIS